MTTRHFSFLVKMANNNGNYKCQANSAFSLSVIWPLNSACKFGFDISFHKKDEPRLINSGIKIRVVS